MDVVTVAAGVFFANVLTAAFLWGMNRAAKYERDGDIPWSVYAALGLPIAFFVVAMLATGAKLPILAALGSQ